MNKTTVFISFFIILLLSHSAMAAKPMPDDTGLPLNTKVPEISAINIAGQTETIAALTGEKGLVLVFFRSADWCPYCKKHLVKLNKWNDKINALGYKLAAISYDSVDILKAFSDKYQLKFPLLADQNHQTMKTMNILRHDIKPDSEHFGIPYPGIMVINSDGIQVHKYFYQGYRKRVKPEDLYEQLEAGFPAP